MNERDKKILAWAKENLDYTNPEGFHRKLESFLADQLSEAFTQFLDTAQPEGEPKCGCGKTAKEHDSLRLLGIHHYWYFHKLPMDGCPYCQDKE